MREPLSPLQLSTPLRTVPAPHAIALVDRIWHRYGLTVCGFGPIAHPHYRDVSASTRSLDQYLAWIRGACALISTDSAAVHIAAGFDVPTLPCS